MSNYLDNGTVLPFGLLSDNTYAEMAGFNKTYNNYPLRMGVVIKAYDVSDDNNRSKLTTEYDVSVIEQNQNRGATTITYKNCMAFDGFGSIADFMEKTYRTLKTKTTTGSGINLSGQNGAIVLLLCLDGMSEKGIIVGGFPHPDRKTNLTSDTPMLEGEFNGVNLKIKSDGSTAVTWNGPTDNDGDPVDPSIEPTEVNIENDGSVQVQVNSGKITFRLDNSTGDVTLTTNGNINATCVNATVTASDTAIIDGETINLGANATDAVIKGTTFAQIFDTHTHIGNLGAPTSPPITPMDSALSTKVNTE